MKKKGAVSVLSDLEQLHDLGDHEKEGGGVGPVRSRTVARSQFLRLDHEKEGAGKPYERTQAGTRVRRDLLPKT